MDSRIAVETARRKFSAPSAGALRAAYAALGSLLSREPGKDEATYASSSPPACSAWGRRCCRPSGSAGFPGDKTAFPQTRDSPRSDPCFRDHLILEYEIPKYDGDLGAANLFVPLDEPTCRRKVEAILEGFPSQRGKPWFTEDLFLSLMRLRGMECNSPSGYAEAFYSRKAVLGTESA